MNRIPRRTYTHEFKVEAVKLITQQGLKVNEVCAKLGMTSQSLRDWIDLQAKGALKASLGADKLSEPQRQIKELQRELASQVIQCGVHRIKRLRKQYHIRCKQKRKFKVTTDSKHKLPIAENFLNREFHPSGPNRV